jgi:site-specific recombinase XerC
MASLVKKRNKYYIRVRLKGGKEKTIPTQTGNRREAERRLRLVQDNEILMKANLQAEADLENLELEEAVNRFIKDRKSNGIRQSTIDSYELALDNLKDANTPSLQVSMLSKKHIQKMVEMLHSKKIRDTKETVKDSTINIRIRSVNAFTNWLFQQGNILAPIKFKQIKLDEQLPKFLTPDELDEFYKKVDNPVLLSTFKVYEGTGIRLSELHNSHQEGNYIIIPAEHSKSRRDRMIPIDADTLRHYLIAKENLYHPDTITKSFRKYADKAGLPGEKTLHSMRHTYALRTLQQTNNIVTVKELLGHSDIKTTLIYTKFPADYISEMLGLDPPKTTETPIAQA